MSKNLLSTSILSAALITTPTTKAVESYVHDPIIDISTRISKGRKIAEFNYMQPFFAREKDLPIFDLKLKTDNHKSKEINVGLAYRHNLDDKAILGAYAYFDHRFTGNNFSVSGLTTGVEVLSKYLDARANIYLPQRKSKKIAHNDTKSINIKGKSIFTVDGGHTYESSFSGYDLEIGTPLFAFSDKLNEKLGTKIYAARYSFTAKGLKAIVGTRFRITQDIFTSYIGNNSYNLYTNAETQYDSVRKRQNFVGLGLRIALCDAQNKHKKKTGLSHRMMETIVRDVDIVTKDQKTDDLIQNLYNQKGQEINELAYVAPGTHEGTGTADNPYSFSQAKNLTRAAIITIPDSNGAQLSTTEASQLNNVLNGKTTVLSTKPSKTTSVTKVALEVTNSGDNLIISTPDNSAKEINVDGKKTSTNNGATRVSLRQAANTTVTAIKAVNAFKSLLNKTTSTPTLKSIAKKITSSSGANTTAATGTTTPAGTPTMNSALLAGIKNGVILKKAPTPTNPAVVTPAGTGNGAGTNATGTGTPTPATGGTPTTGTNPPATGGTPTTGTNPPATGGTPTTGTNPTHVVTPAPQPPAGTNPPTTGGTSTKPAGTNPTATVAPVANNAAAEPTKTANGGAAAEPKKKKRKSNNKNKKKKATTTPVMPTTGGTSATPAGTNPTGTGTPTANNGAAEQPKRPDMVSILAKAAGKTLKKAPTHAPQPSAGTNATPATPTPITTNGTTTPTANHGAATQNPTPTTGGTSTKPAPQPTAVTGAAVTNNAAAEPTQPANGGAAGTTPKPTAGTPTPTTNTTTPATQPAAIEPEETKEELNLTFAEKRRIAAALFKKKNGSDKNDTSTSTKEPTGKLRSPDDNNPLAAMLGKKQQTDNTPKDEYVKHALLSAGKITVENAIKAFKDGISFEDFKAGKTSNAAEPTTGGAAEEPQTTAEPTPYATQTEEELAAAKKKQDFEANLTNEQKKFFQENCADQFALMSFIKTYRLDSFLSLQYAKTFKETGKKGASLDLSTKGLKKAAVTTKKKAQEDDPFLTELKKAQEKRKDGGFKKVTDTKNPDKTNTTPNALNTAQRKVTSYQRSLEVIKRKISQTTDQEQLKELEERLDRTKKLLQQAETDREQAKNKKPTNPSNTTLGFNADLLNLVTSLNSTQNVGGTTSTDTDEWEDPVEDASVSIPKKITQPADAKGATPDTAKSNTTSGKIESKEETPEEKEEKDKAAQEKRERDEKAHNEFATTLAIKLSSIAAFNKGGPDDDDDEEELSDIE